MPVTGAIIRIDVVLNFELEGEILGFGESIKVMAPRVLASRIKKRLEKPVASTISEDASQECPGDFHSGWIFLYTRIFLPGQVYLSLPGFEIKFHFLFAISRKSLFLPPQIREDSSLAQLVRASDC